MTIASVFHYLQKVLSLGAFDFWPVFGITPKLMQHLSEIQYVGRGIIDK